MLRKIYPSSRRQLREGRVPRRLAFVWETEGGPPETLVEETFSKVAMSGFQPPRPFAKAGKAFDLTEAETIRALERLANRQLLSRIGPVAAPTGTVGARNSARALERSWDTPLA